MVKKKAAGGKTWLPNDWLKKELGKKSAPGWRTVKYSWGHHQKNPRKSVSGGGAFVFLKTIQQANPERGGKKSEER